MGITRTIRYPVRTGGMGESFVDKLLLSDDFYSAVKRGKVPGHSIVHKFGSGTVGTALTPVATGGNYQTPTTATALEFVSDSSNDTSDGSGAREITFEGLGSNWSLTTQSVATNGLTPVPLPTHLTRLHRWYVSLTGTYASAGAGSHAGNLTVRVAGAGATWSTIDNTPFPVGQSQIGAYSIPIGYTGYLVGKLIYTDTNKNADIYFFRREHADDVTPPYTGVMRLIEREIGVQGGFVHHFDSPRGPFVGPCDVGFMAKVISGTADVSAEFELLLVEDGY